MHAKNRLIDEKAELMGRKTAVLFNRVIIAMTVICSILVLTGTVWTARRSLFRKLDFPAAETALLLLSSVLLCGLILFIYSMLDRWQEKQLKIYLLAAGAVMLLIFGVVLSNFSPVPYTDAANIQEGALYFVKHPDRVPIPVDAPQARYYGRFANNNFLTILYIYFFRFLAFIGITDVQRPLQAAGALGLIISSVILYLTAAKLKGMRAGAKLFTLCVLNPLYYLLPLWPYTNVFCIPFMAGVVYFGICLYRARSMRSRILFGMAEAVCAAVGYLIRPIAIFPLIALIVCAVCRVLVDPKSVRHLIRCALPCVIAGAILFSGANSVSRKYFSSVSGENFPITHWLMMGAHGDGALNKDDVSFTRSFATKEEKKQATLERMISYYKDFTLSEYAVFWYKKLCKTWAQGDGGDLGRKISQDRMLTDLYPWVVSDRSDAFRMYCFAYWQAVWFLIIVLLFRLLKSCEMGGYSRVFAVTLFGGFLFYTFWEAKGSYSLPFLTTMLPLASEGADRLTERLPRLGRKLHNRYGKCAVAAGLGIAAVICIGGDQMMTAKKIAYSDWSICSGAASVYARNIHPGAPADEIRQEFYAEKSFDHIRLEMIADKEARKTKANYRMEIKNEADETLYISDIYADDAHKGSQVTVEIPEIVPKGREKFILRLVRNPENAGGMYFRRRPTQYLDVYEGKLFADQKEETADLMMSVWREYQRPWCSEMAAALLNGAIFAAAALFLLRLYFENRVPLQKSGDGGDRS